MVKVALADKVAKALNYSRFSSGDFMRKIAIEKNITLNQLSKIAENDNGEIDNQIDNEVSKLNETQKSLLILGLLFIS